MDIHTPQDFLLDQIEVITPFVILVHIPEDTVITASRLWCIQQKATGKRKKLVKL